MDKPRTTKRSIMTWGKPGAWEVSKVSGLCFRLAILCGPLIFVAGISGCGGPRNAAPAIPESRTENRALALEYFVLGNNYYYKGLIEPAFRAYSQAMIYEPDKTSLRNLIVSRALESGRADLATRIVESVPAKERGAKEWKLLSEAYLRSGRLDDAEAAIQKALPELQDDPSVFFTLGVICEARKKLPQAIENFRRAARLSGGSAEAEEKSALRYLQIGKTDSARTILERLSAKYPNELRFVRSLAMVEEAKGNDSGAIIAYRKVVEMDSADEAAWSSLGNLYFRLEQWKNAQECYERLYAADSTNMPIGRALAYTYIEVGQLDKAERLLKDLIAANNDEEDLYYYLGLVYGEKASAALIKNPKDTSTASNHQESALIELNKAIALRKDFQEARIQLGFVHLNRKSFREAVTVFQEIVEQWPKFGRAHFYLSLAQRAMGQKDKAIASLVQAQKIEPKNTGVLFELGSLYEQTGDSEKSEKAFLRLLELDPKHALSLNYLGYMWAEKGVKLDEAKGFIERALVMEPQNAAYLDSYGWVLFKLGQYSEAENYLQKAAAAMQSPDPVILDPLGDVYQALNNKGKAETYWKKALEVDPKNETLKKKLADAKGPGVDKEN